MRPSVPPIPAEKAEAARELLNEYDDIVTHDRVLSREQTVGQFTLGFFSLKGGTGAGIAVLAAQRGHEILDRGPGINDKVALSLTLLGAAAGGLRRIVGRRRDAHKVAELEERRTAPHTS